jgi:hypothetical protein
MCTSPLVLNLADGTRVYCTAPKYTAAVIDGEQVYFDLADSNFDAYESLNGKIRYLGYGQYLPPNNIGFYHFWAWK